MKIALVGYGKMGKMIETLASNQGHEIILKLDEAQNVHQGGIQAASFAGVDAAIEFSHPEAALPNIKALLELGIPTVCGTTGWHDRLDEVQRLCLDRHGSFVWSSNFSIGVQVFYRVVQSAAELLKDKPNYEAWAYEIHHSQKKDAPSGTLLQLVDKMNATGYQLPIDISSNRAGKIPGTHEIGFDSSVDTLTLRHTARSREGFALGALKAAEWIVDRKGFYEFGELLFSGKSPV